MSQKYLPLYRKYRPQSFADLVGQDGLTKALSNAIALNKIAHAYLFCGPRGTGKTSSARIFAKSLNCVNGPTITPCSTCPSCVDITNSTPVDVIEIDAASNRSVEDTQKILEKIQYVPVQGKYKIYIIDEVHMLSTTAFNSLLKTLEEPPENVIFILATTESHKVLETIVSRCQRFDFRRITTNDIAKRLSEIAQKEDIKITNEAIFSIAKNSQGGMRDALALLDQISIYGVEREITQEDVDNLLGRLSIDKLFKITQSFINKSPQEAISIINAVYDDGQEPIQILNSLILYYRNLLIIKSSNSAENIIELTQLNESNIQKMTTQADLIDVKTILRNIDRLSHYLKQIKSNTNRQLWLELCSIELSSANSIVNETAQTIQPQKQQLKPIKDIPKLIPPKVEEEPLSKKEDVTPVSTIQEPKNEPIQEQQIFEETLPQPKENSLGTSTTPTSVTWADILNKINSIPAKMFFNGLATPVEITQDIIKLSFANENLINQAKMEVKYKAFETACKDVLNTEKIRVEFIVGKHQGKKETELKPQKTSPPAVATPSMKPTEQVAAPIQTPKEDVKVQPNKPEQDIEEETTLPEAIEEIKTPINNIEYSEQARMLADVFNGKIM